MNRFFIFFVTMTLLAGCYFKAAYRSEPVVMESNKRQKPVWAVMPSGVFFSYGEGLGFVFHRKQLLFLESGLKQSENIAKESCLRSIWQSLSKASSVGQGEQHEATERKSVQSQIAQLESFLEVGDIYYEALKTDAAGADVEYEVMVLLKFSRKVYQMYPKVFDRLKI